MSTTDSEGVYHHEESDLAAPGVGFSEMLNKPGVSISTQLGLIRAEFEELEDIVGGIGGATELDHLTDVDLTVPPTDGQVLAYDGASSTFKAETVAAGGAPAFTSRYDAVPVQYATSVGGSTDCTKGVGGIISTDVTLTKLGARMTTVAGRTYRFRVYEIDAALHSTQVGSAYDVASPGSLTLQLVETAVSIDLDRGKFYALTVADISGAGPGVHVDSAQSRGGSAHFTPSQSWSFGSLNPTGSSTWVRAGSTYGIVVETVAR
jgi:hypothetical protein